eukprot:CAMPEP_0184873570 /NCGR_PEP_ID=MMETSP0580-20130426/41920_1 /TAXON_ID=1118495 /ORGANISM="Dactyliosolen fragilissimus" /LENGTH=1291 /DNA_ID=CAMNT_0027376495 /DNA_START=86 /DNA_END=3961 /DNA_ORIENTATION=-
MQHTYLRYECADTFSLTTSAATTSTPTTSPLAFLPSSSDKLLSTAGSYLLGLNLRTHQPILKMGHRQLLSGGVGTGRALNSDEILCVLVHFFEEDTKKQQQQQQQQYPQQQHNEGRGEGYDEGYYKICTGWKDGSVRIWDGTIQELSQQTSTSSTYGSHGGINSNNSTVHSLLMQSNNPFSNSDTEKEPLVLNGHSDSPVRCLAIDDAGIASRLASGGSDGTIVLWDIVAETGLFRLLGHRAAITDISFVSKLGSSSSSSSGSMGHRAAITDISFVSKLGSSSSSSSSSNDDGNHYDTTTTTTTTTNNNYSELFNAMDILVSSSLDGLIKIWDLNGQCCTQTIASHRGEVSCHSILNMKPDPISSSIHQQQQGGEGGSGRCRMVTGCADGQVRVFAIRKSNRMLSQEEDTKARKEIQNEGKIANDDAIQHIQKDTQDQQDMDTENTNIKGSYWETQITNAIQSQRSDYDDICHYMGTIPPPPNVATSNEKISSIQYHPNGKFLAFCRSNGRNIDVYAIRSERESHRKRTRRLRRLREKEGKVEAGGSVATEGDNAQSSHRGTKRGILDDIEEEDEDNLDEGDMESKHNQETSLLLPKEELKASDEYEYVGSIRCSHKVKGFAFSLKKDKSQSKIDTGGGKGAGFLRIACALATNAIEIHSLSKQINTNKKTTQPAQYLIEKMSTLDMYGHPTGIRSIALSSDDTLACSVSKNMAKVWNVANRSCQQSLTLSTGTRKANCYCLCSSFLPGNEYVVIGTREGSICILHIASGDIVYVEEKAHDGAIWSLDVKRPLPHEGERIAIMTGSADCKVKFWDLEMQGEDSSSDSETDDSDDSDDDGNTKKQQSSSSSIHSGHPMVVHTRTLETKDDVIAVRYSHTKSSSSSETQTQRLVFVSTLDCQIRVFFDDTLAFFLNLYGHSLPALAIDSSDDGTLLVSGGADKTIKIWGLDFGDTHKTLHGHDDSITDIKFVNGTHNFFSVSKDHSLRYWDADRFEMILILNGHMAEISCLSVSRTGAFVLTGGMDRQIRVWERTKDIVFLEEERERELESILDKVDGRREDKDTASLLNNSLKRRDNPEMEDMDDDDEEGNKKNPQSEAAVKRSILSISAGDRIMEAIELADQESMNTMISSKNKKTQISSSNPLLLGLEPPQYILWILRTVKSAELEPSLLVLPLGHVERLIVYLVKLLRSGRGVEICARVSIFLIKVHQHQIISSKKLLIPLRELRRLLKLRLIQARDTIGYNLAAMRVLEKVAKDRKQQYYIPDANTTKQDIWSDLGLGSDLAASLQKK